MAKAVAKAKDDSNPKDRLGALKVPLHLIPAVPMIYAALVFELGAYKYGEFNWRDKAVRITVYLGAIKRHEMAMMAGEDIDPESGLPHTGHIIACACIIEDARAAGGLIDDRFAKDGAALLLGKMTADNYNAAMLAQSRTPCGTLASLRPNETPEAFFDRVVAGVKERKAKRVAR
jgi:hypothetical protein